MILFSGHLNQWQSAIKLVNIHAVKFAETQYEDVVQLKFYGIHTIPSSRKVPELHFDSSDLIEEEYILPVRILREDLLIMYLPCWKDLIGFDRKNIQYF